MKSTFDGFKRLQKQLKDLKETEQVPVSAMFTPDFMVAFTEFSSIHEMFSASGFDTSTDESFAAIPDDEWDSFIASTTRFSSWQEMIQEGARQWVAKKLE